MLVRRLLPAWRSRPLPGMAPPGAVLMSEVEPFLDGEQDGQASGVGGGPQRLMKEDRQHDDCHDADDETGIEVAEDEIGGTQACQPAQRGEWREAEPPTQRGVKALAAATPQEAR